MPTLAQMLREGRTDDIWRKYCGFIDLNMNDFMHIQKRLLMEQLDILSRCALGKKILGNTKINDLHDFRREVPLTTYDDYAPLLGERQEEILPSKPLFWVHTTGKVGHYRYKWAPYTEQMVNENARSFVAALIFATSSDRGKFTLRENFNFLYGMAPLPYVTGLVPHGLGREIKFNYLPPVNTAEQLTFERRNREGFRQGLVRGIDLFFGVTPILVKIGEAFVNRNREDKSTEGSLFSYNPLALMRLAKALAGSKINNRPILPKDVWSLKGIICGGTDSSVYRERINYYWGRRPLEVYGGTELGTVATQTWDHEGMTFFPDINFLEFIPEPESQKSRKYPWYQPQTLLLNEVAPGESYELVITKFKGGAFVRYRVGDIIKITALRNEQLNINLPQMIYVDRISDIIDLASFTRLNEKTIGQAVDALGLESPFWFARKVVSDGHTVLNLGIEFNNSFIGEKYIKQMIHDKLKELDSDYGDLEKMMGIDPLRLNILSTGTINEYVKQQRNRVTDPADIYPARMNPPEDTVNKLLDISARLTASKNTILASEVS
jgi:hypothetical protein